MTRRRLEQSTTARRSQRGKVESVDSQLCFWKSVVEFNSIRPLYRVFGNRGLTSPNWYIATFTSAGTAELFDELRPFLLHRGITAD